MLTKEQILAADDLPFEDVKVPEWGGGTVRVRSMTGAERDAYEVSLTDPKKPGQANLDNVRARLLMFCLADEKNQRLFTDADIAVLGAKGAKPLDRLFSIARRLNGIGQEDIDALGKSSAAAPAGASTTT